jgi:hypothetical protein
MADRPPPHLVSTAQTVLATFDTGIPACLIGGMVISRWGQPRATTDADVTALAPYGDEARVLDILLARFEPRRPDARAFALDSRVLLISSEDVSIDVALAAFPFEIEAIERCACDVAQRDTVNSRVSWGPRDAPLAYIKSDTHHSRPVPNVPIVPASVRSVRCDQQRVQLTVHEGSVRANLCANLRPCPSARSCPSTNT